MNKEELRAIARNNYAAQMEMLGYDTDGNPKDMVEVVRCKDCKHFYSEVKAFLQPISDAMQITTLGAEIGSAQMEKGK